MRVSSSYSSVEGYTNRVGVLFLDFLKVINRPFSLAIK